MNEGTRVQVIGGYPMCLRARRGMIIAVLSFAEIEVRLDADQSVHFRTYRFTIQDLRPLTEEELADELENNCSTTACQMDNCSANSIHKICIVLSKKYAKSLHMYVCDDCFQWLIDRTEKRIPISVHLVED